MTAVQVGDQLGQRFTVTRRGHGDALEMVFVAEIFVLYPVGQIQAHWHFVQFPAKVRHFADTLDHFFPEVVKTEAGAGAGVQDNQPHRVVVDGVCLPGHEQDVLLTQLSHRSHKAFLRFFQPTLARGITPRTPDIY